MNRKLFGYALAAALSLGTIGGTLAYATDLDEDLVTQVSSTKQGDCGLENLDAETKNKVEEIQNQAKKDLEALGVTLPEKHSKKDTFTNLDEATKVKAVAIFEKMKAGTLSREEAATQLEALGVTLSERYRRDFFADLDAKTKAKAEAIVDQAKDGTITREEATTQLKALGVTVPDKHDWLAGLDDATKEKAQAIVEKAEAQLEELGVEARLFGGGPHHGFGHGHGHRH